MTALKICSKLLTAVVYAAYVMLLALLLYRRDMRVIRVIAVPAFIFFLTTAVRSGINAPRPYEKYDLVSLVKKNTHGKSCPSRHTACAFAIALACLYISVPAGIFMLVVASAISLSRPVMGVHFPLDVLFGAAISLLPGIAGFFIV